MLLLASRETWVHRVCNAGEGEGALGEASWGGRMSGEHTAGRLTTFQWAQERLANTERLAATKWGADRDGWLEDVGHWKDIVSIITAAPETAAERDRLRAEVERLKAWVTDLQSGLYVNCVYCGHRYGPGETTPVSMAAALKAHVEQCPQHPISALRAEKAKLVAVLQEYLHDGRLQTFEDRERFRKTACAALAKASATEGGNDDGADPTTTELLKPRGNGGVVSANICFNALLLVGDVDTQGIAPDSWTQEELDRAYDWAMRVHLHASDNDDVLVPPRPHYVPRESPNA